MPLTLSILREFTAEKWSVIRNLICVIEFAVRSQSKHMYSPKLRLYTLSENVVGSEYFLIRRVSADSPFAKYCALRNEVLKPELRTPSAFHCRRDRHKHDSRGVALSTDNDRANSKANRSLRLDPTNLFSQILTPALLTFMYAGRFIQSSCSAGSFTCRMKRQRGRPLLAPIVLHVQNWSPFEAR